MTRFAFPKPEPLRVEHESFRDAVLGKDADIVTLRQAVATVAVANAAAESAATGQDGHDRDAGGGGPVKICVVALGKIGLPLAVQFASKGHEVIGADVNADDRRPGQRRASSRSRARRTWPRSCRTWSPEGCSPRPPTPPPLWPQSEAVVVVVPLFVDEEGRPDFDWMDAATQAIAAGPAARDAWSRTRPRFLSAPPAPATRRCSSKGSGLVAGEGFHLVFSPERVFTGRVFADLRKYPKLVGGIDADSEQRGIAFYESVLDFDERHDLPEPNGVWPMGSAEAAEMAKLAETTYRDVNIGLANQFARFADKQRHRRLRGDRGVQLPAVQPHPPAGDRRRWALHPGVPAAVPAQRS